MYAAQKRESYLYIGRYLHKKAHAAASKHHLRHGGKQDGVRRAANEQTLIF
mgnify:CR=1 FL=1